MTWKFMCKVKEAAVNFEEHIGTLHLPDMHYPDMMSTIEHFTSADPECEAIYTFVGGKQDTIYVKIDGVWSARG